MKERAGVTSVGDVAQKNTQYTVEKAGLILVFKKTASIFQQQLVPEQGDKRQLVTNSSLVLQEY